MKPEKIYLNTASCGLLSKESVDAANVLYNGMLTDASNAVEPIRDSGIARIRDTVAAFIDAPASQVALIPNFSWGMNAIVQSLKGDEKVLLYKNDYPSLIAPFTVNRFDISWIGDTDGFEIDSKELKRQLLSERIGILAISHVQWLTAFKIDIQDIGQFCKEHGITFILDATQSLGAVPVYLSKHHIDVLICSNYKWMNAGFGTGIMYVSESFMRKYPPVVAGSNSYSYVTGTFNFEPSIMNFEPGHLNMPGLLILEKAIQQKLQQGIEKIASHNLHLLQLLSDSIDASLILGTREMQQRSSIVMLKDPGHLFDRLTNNSIVAIKRGANIRISIHFYNTENEVRRLIELLQP